MKASGQPDSPALVSSAETQVERLKSRVGEELWGSSGKEPKLETIETALAVIRNCPVDCFAFDLFQSEVTADGDVLPDWDDGGEPAPTVLVTAQGTVAHSAVYKTSEDRGSKGVRPWDGELSPELLDAFDRFMAERGARQAERS